MIYKEGNDGASPNGTRVHDNNLYGNPSVDAFYLTDIQGQAIGNLTIYENIITGWSHAIQINGADSTSPYVNITFNNNYVSDCNNAVSVGYQLGSSYVQNVNIQSNNFVNIGVPSYRSVPYTTIYVGTNVPDVVIQNNIFTNCRAPILIDQGINTIVLNNTGLS
jgi:hypothetical protein